MDSGIYEIRNLVNGKRYFGSATSIRRRWYEHQSTARRGNHRNPKFQSAWDKYGESAFRFSVLFYCDEQDLEFYEQLVLNFFDAVKTGYNLSPTARTSRGVKLSQETCAKISASKRGRKLSEEHKKKIGAASKGNKYALGSKHSPETKAKYSAQRKGNKINLGRKLTEDHKAKVSAALTGRKRPPYSPEWCAAISAGNRGKKQTPEQQAKRLISLKSPETRAKMSASAKARCSTPEARQILSERARQQWEKKKNPPKDPV